MEKYLFVTKMHTSNPKILQRKSILTVSEDSAYVLEILLFDTSFILFRGYNARHHLPNPPSPKSDQHQFSPNNINT